MSDLLASLYPWTKSLHILSVISWMAGLLYLPRLFVNHVEQSDPGDSKAEMLQMMERKLLRMIMNPAMIVAWVAGLCLVFTPGIVDWSSLWPWTKAIAVSGMTWFHHWLGWRRRDLMNGTNTWSGRQFRMMNELPTVLMVVIVLSVVIRF